MCPVPSPLFALYLTALGVTLLAVPSPPRVPCYPLNPWPRPFLLHGCGGRVIRAPVQQTLALGKHRGRLGSARRGQPTQVAVGEPWKKAHPTWAEGAPRGERRVWNALPQQQADNVHIVHGRPRCRKPQLDGRTRASPQAPCSRQARASPSRGPPPDSLRRSCQVHTADNSDPIEPPQSTTVPDLLV